MHSLGPTGGPTRHTVDPAGVAAYRVMREVSTQLKQMPGDDQSNIKKAEREIALLIKAVDPDNPPGELGSRFRAILEKHNVSLQ